MNLDQIVFIKENDSISVNKRSSSISLSIQITIHVSSIAVYFNLKSTTSYKEVEGQFNFKYRIRLGC